MTVGPCPGCDGSGVSTPGAYPLAVCPTCCGTGAGSIADALDPDRWLRPSEAADHIHVSAMTVARRGLKHRWFGVPAPVADAERDHELRTRPHKFASEDAT